MDNNYKQENIKDLKNMLRSWSLNAMQEHFEIITYKRRLDKWYKELKWFEKIFCKEPPKYSYLYPPYSGSFYEVRSVEEIKLASDAKESGEKVYMALIEMLEK